MSSTTPGPLIGVELRDIWLSESFDFNWIASWPDGPDIRAHRDADIERFLP